MKFSYNWLQDYIVEKLPEAEKLKNLFLKHSFEIESIEKIDGDFVFDIDILSNRAFDCFSHIGMAKEIAAFCGLTIKIPNFNCFIKKNNKEKLVEIKIDNQNLCPRYIGLIMDNVNIGNSPRKIQHRLKICGLQLINGVVDILNYVMLETGQPLHAFDFEKIKNQNKKIKEINVNINIRKAKNGEKIITLDNKKYNLDKDILIIADGKEPLAIAGIRGGKKAEIGFNTKTIIIEAANFAPLSIRQASQLLKLRTDASWRFENGVNINAVEYSIKRAACLIQEITGGEIIDYSDIGSQKLSPKIVTLELNYLNNLLGRTFSVGEIEKILNNIFFEFDDSFTKKETKIEFKDNIFTVEIPCYRQDISIPEDLIEEIGRISGYENIKSEKPIGLLSVVLDDEIIFWENFIKDLLQGSGFNEVYNYSFISEDNFSSVDKIVFNKIVRIKNPISKDYNCLRPKLILNFKNNIEENLKYFSEIKIFEIGNVFHRQNNAVTESKNIAVCLAKKNRQKQKFFLSLKDDLKGVIEYLCKKLHIDINIIKDDKDIDYELIQHSFFQKNQFVALKIDKDILGYFGGVDLADYSVAYFEINLEQLIKIASQKYIFQPISPYPSISRDLSIFVPINTNYQEVVNTIKFLDEKLITEIKLKKIFIFLPNSSKNQQQQWIEVFPERKFTFFSVKKEKNDFNKNFLLEITYQSLQKNLSSSEIEKIQEKIIKKLEQRKWRVVR